MFLNKQPKIEITNSKWTTQDELRYLAELAPSALLQYAEALKLRRNWDGLSSIQVWQAVQVRLALLPPAPAPTLTE